METYLRKVNEGCERCGASDRAATVIQNDMVDVDALVNGPPCFLKELNNVARPFNCYSFIQHHTDIWCVKRRKPGKVIFAECRDVASYIVFSAKDGIGHFF